MATLAQIWNLFGAVRAAGETVSEPRIGTNSAAGRLRPLPNEDVYLFVKRIDNSGVVRAANPRAGRTCWRFIGAAGMVTLLLIALFLPSACGLLLGHDIEDLKAKQKALLDERAVLELDEARLLDPARLQALARVREFAPPAPGRLVYLNPQADGVLAMNVKSK